MVAGLTEHPQQMLLGMLERMGRLVCSRGCTKIPFMQLNWLICLFYLFRFGFTWCTSSIYHSTISAFWLFGGMPKSLCNHELSIIIVTIVVIVICGQFSYTHTIFLAKTRLIHSDDDDTYKIPGFEVSCRNDQLWNQTTRPPHGLIRCLRETFQI